MTTCVFEYLYEVAVWLVSNDDHHR